MSETGLEQASEVLGFFWFFGCDQDFDQDFDQHLDFWRANQLDERASSRFPPSKGVLPPP